MMANNIDNRFKFKFELLNISDNKLVPLLGARVISRKMLDSK